ncbi:hypothetical protein F5Y01DRAFT_307292 [Xylaria sp. FL0043]|nr:hypothetical protein F5Y01DRAFT_307292 [Xylaria sp. FL0043]
MDELQDSRSRTIESLSVELVCMILSALPDVESLQTAVLSCPLFYSAFRAAETSVTTHVLFSQIDASVLPEAMAAIESSRLGAFKERCKRQRWDAARDFITRNLRKRPIPPDTWLLKRALPLGRLHSCVEELAKQFAEATVSRGPAARCPLSTTNRERCRIQRALYRFEIYCKLLCEADWERRIYHNQDILFFSNFSPWENEQLGCVHDFLVRAVSPAFNEIVEHDIHWGAARVDYAQSMDAPRIQYVLSLGLKKLYEITRAETYEDRERILCSGGLPPQLIYFLYEGFRAATRKIVVYDTGVHVRPPYYHDQDSGPADVWRWAHYEESWWDWVYQKNRHNLRKWGYVMWDRFLCLHYSQELRRLISRRGGSGWWSWEDESKVKWREKKQTLPDGGRPQSTP